MGWKGEKSEDDRWCTPTIVLLSGEWNLGVRVLHMTVIWDGMSILSKQLARMVGGRELHQNDEMDVT